jgi:hypothetical protein
VRMYTATDLVRMIERAGFSDWKAYGGFESEPFSVDSRLVLVAIR